MAKCFLCGKKASVQRRSMHQRGVASAKFRRRAKKVQKIYKANIQKITLKVGGVKLSGKFCTRCISRMKKEKKSPEKKEKKAKV
jgi:ribosomal protein L28